MSRPQIYTIGYQKLTPERLRVIAVALKVTVVDCRTKPVSRKKGFGKNQLEALLPNYVHRPDLGGFGKTSPHGIAWLRKQNGRLLLLCLEEAPGECHRHHDICAPHFPNAIHIYQDELFTAGELTRAYTDDDGYVLHGFLSELIETA